MICGFIAILIYKLECSVPRLTIAVEYIELNYTKLVVSFIEHSNWEITIMHFYILTN